LYVYDPFYYLCQRLEQMEQELTQLKKQNEELQKLVAQIKPIQVEKIEYKIHELHVQTLSGTLNVGLTANGDESAVGDIIEQVVEEHRKNIMKENDATADDDSSPHNPDHNLPAR
jgi:spore germination protein PC